jgi:hypothetical protein
MKYLFCNGCSFVYGENAGYLLDKDSSWNPKLRFTKILADKLGLEEINLAANGESNHYTVRTTYDWIEANKDKVKDTIFILGATEPLRLELFQAFKNKYQAVSMRWVAGAIQYLNKSSDSNDISRTYEEELYHTQRIFGADVTLDLGVGWFKTLLKYFYTDEEEKNVAERLFKFINSHINYRGGKLVMFNSIYDSIKDKSDFNFYNFPEEPQQRNFWKGYNSHMQDIHGNWKTNCHHPSHISHEWFANELYNFILNEKLISSK